MSDSDKAILTTIFMTIILCVTIVTWAYIAYNPKECPITYSQSQGV